jgi:hypothetical protein
MSITAAVLAVITLLSHRAHNDTIVLASRENASQIEANIEHTRSSDQWAFYQGKKTRESELSSLCELIALTAKGSDPVGAELKQRWEKEIARYQDEEKEIKKEAESLAAAALAKQTNALHFKEESEHTHHQGDRYDLGELFLEIALVLGSISMIAKRRIFLVVSIVLTLTGSVVATTGYLDIHPFYDDSKVASPESKK